MHKSNKRYSYIHTFLVSLYLASFFLYIILLIRKKKELLGRLKVEPFHNKKEIVSIRFSDFFLIYLLLLSKNIFLNKFISPLIGMLLVIFFLKKLFS